MLDSSTHFDIIIAGGGPAGSTAAYLLSSAGFNVLIIDKSRFPRKKLCGGLITVKTAQLLKRAFGVTVDSLKELGIIEYESDRYEVYGKRRRIIEGWYEAPFYFINREKYDDFLLKRAQQQGTSLVEGDGVKSIDLSTDSIKTDGGWDFTAEVIIGADGMNSKVRRNFPPDLFGRDNWTANVASAHEVFISRKELKKQVSCPALYFGFLSHGYGWIFPQKDVVIAGICGLRGKSDKSILSRFRDFLEEMDLSRNGEEKINSYVLPYGCYLKSPAFRNLLLTGDAAGYADPLVGEGIYYAQRSAELAAQAIIGVRSEGSSYEQLEAHYVEKINKHILVEMEYAERIRNAIFSFFSPFDFFLLGKIMKLSGSRPIETIHGVRSYNWMKKR